MTSDLKKLELYNGMVPAACGAASGPGMYSGTFAIGLIVTSIYDLGAVIFVV